MQSGIYMLLNIETMKYYVGSSLNLTSRKHSHLKQLRKGVHSNKNLQEDFTDYGELSFKFVILELCTIDDLYKREVYWITEKDATDPFRGYNITIPTEKSFLNTTKAYRKRKRKVAYDKLDLDISFEEYNTLKETEDIRLREAPKKRPRPVTQIDVKTGELIAHHNTIKECADTIGFTKNQLGKLGFLLKGTGKFKYRKSYLGYIFVYTEEYDPEFNYMNYKSKNVREKLEQSVQI